MAFIPENLTKYVPYVDLDFKTDGQRQRLLDESSWYSFLTDSENDIYYSTKNEQLISNSNFDVALKELGGKSKTIKVISEGEIYVLLINETDYKALKDAEEMHCALSDYPILSESDFSLREQNYANEIWEYMSCEDRFDYIRDNQEDFECNNMGDMISLLSGDDFTGNASEFISCLLYTSPSPRD